MAKVFVIPTNEQQQQIETIAPEVNRPVIKKAYFAKMETEDVEKEGEQTLHEVTVTTSHTSLWSIANHYEGVEVQDIKDANGLKSDTIRPNQKLKIPNKSKKQKVTFTPLDFAYVEDKVYVVVETEHFKDKTVAVKIEQGKVKVIEEVGTAIKMLFNDETEEAEQGTAKVGEWSTKTEIDNTDDLKNLAIIKVHLRPKTDEKLEEWKTAITDHADKQSMLHLLADGASENEGVEDENIDYKGSNKEEGDSQTDTTKNVWLDIKGKRFTLKTCDCGKDIKGKLKRKKYGSVYGPVFDSDKKIKDFPHWATMIAAGTITADDKEIILFMSPNEGDLDALQGYDSQAVSCGAMQKTVNPQGTGEFPRQVWEFKQAHPTLFKKYLGGCCQWTVTKTGKKTSEFYGENENYTMTYIKPDGTKLTGDKLKKFIKEPWKKVKNDTGDTDAGRPLYPLINLIRDDEFQKKQIIDFKWRIDYALKQKAKGKKYKISEYLSTNFGKAIVVDQHVNRPAYIDDDFATALDNFFTIKDTEVDAFNKDKPAAQHKTKISRNPNDWTAADKKTYETAIMSDYGFARRGTDMPLRYAKIKKAAGLITNTIYQKYVNLHEKKRKKEITAAKFKEDWYKVEP